MTELVLAEWVSGLIELSKVRGALGPEFGRKVLHDSGWDGVQPLLAIGLNRTFSRYDPRHTF